MKIVSQEKRLFITGFIFSFCIALAAYVNAAYLKNFISAQNLGFIYSTTALLTLCALYFFEYIGGRYGVQKTLVSSLVISGIAALILAFTKTTPLLCAAFICMQVGLGITKFSTDILLETHKNKNEGEGTLRGAYLSITNLSWILAALLGGYLASINSQIIYTINGSIYTLLALGVLFWISQRKEDIIQKTSFLQKIKKLLEEKSTRKVIISEFILQTFFVTMIIFSPLYLKEILGFNFKEIGLMFSIMLIPFALLQYPLGKLADKKYGEKEMMIIAYILLGASVYLFVSTKNHSFMVITVILFVSRVGACILEVMNDAYFFNVTQDYKKTLPIFKSMAAVALLVFSTLGSTIVAVFSYKTLFISLALFIIILGFVNIYNLKDTR